MHLKDESNPTLCEGKLWPCIYSDIRRWMIELPKGNLEGAIDGSLIEVCYSLPFLSIRGALTAVWSREP